MPLESLAYFFYFFFLVLLLCQRPSFHYHADNKSFDFVIKIGLCFDLNSRSLNNPSFAAREICSELAAVRARAGEIEFAAISSAEWRFTQSHYFARFLFNFLFSI